MERYKPISLLNLLLSLSEAMDLAGPELVQHQLRTAFIAWELGRTAKLSEARLEQLFYAALLHDIGALSVEEKYSILSGTSEEEFGDHGARGEVLLRKLPFLGDAASLVGDHHTNGVDQKYPISENLNLERQILQLADTLERSITRSTYILYQQKYLTERVNEMSGAVLNPDVVDLFNAVSAREEFWLDMTSRRLYPLLLNNGPSRRIEVGIENLFQIAEIFANIIDFRSRFTSTHSSGVSASATMIAKMFGLTESEVVSMEVAGYLHDLGKLAIPNSILEKPGAMTLEEYALMRSHTYYTYSVLNTIGGLQQIAEWGAYHHERLDGSGYPFHCKATELSIGARIMMVADVFTAMAEDRPYRKGMVREEVTRILKDFATRSLLEKRIVDLVVDNYQEVFFFMKQKQNAAREFYENQFAMNR
jgi:HD-GYP domain-containing protein (c-di-GMP phosphodiesterase class II)